jgi:predicted nucleic acid-binding protein
LAELRDSSHIIEPVAIEFLAGICGREEMEAAEAYVGSFSIPPNGDVRPEDWRTARDVARRVPTDGKPLPLGDCLIRAVAKRVNFDVDTFDQRFPR